jgi:hypothetical protein
VDLDRDSCHEQVELIETGGVVLLVYKNIFDQLWTLSKRGPDTKEPAVS